MKWKFALQHLFFSINIRSHCEMFHLFIYCLATYAGLLQLFDPLKPVLTSLHSPASIHTTKSNQQQMDKSTCIKLPILQFFIFDNTLLSDVHHNMEEKISRYRYYVHVYKFIMCIINICCICLPLPLDNKQITGKILSSAPTSWNFAEWNSQNTGPLEGDWNAFITVTEGFLLGLVWQLSILSVPGTIMVQRNIVVACSF